MHLCLILLGRVRGAGFGAKSPLPRDSPVEVGYDERILAYRPYYRAYLLQKGSTLVGTGGKIFFRLEEKDAAPAVRTRLSTPWLLDTQFGSDTAAQRKTPALHRRMRSGGVDAFDWGRQMHHPKAKIWTPQGAET